ncbi:hypothetical protein LAZ40_04850 [Cereibacter sphaeroides]|uniref:hypothetical protein n=1 Tax=Cereibacter sphaeroides TaxID=1063 RepID=UPI001F46E092|nr:hypothetical protein [Cereibacter sphaeroides]MCE6958385.1 hypothetical protein [Cereibacter sphaeroides]MCE6972252.1 hypothetical protein [Cereibacter sphaeroides]
MSSPHPAEPSSAERIAELEAEVSRLSALVESRYRDIRLVDIDENGQLQLQGSLFEHMAAFLAEMLKVEGRQEPANYTESELHHPELGRLTLTLQRASGKTPHQLRREAELQRDALEARLRDLAGATGASAEVAILQARIEDLAAQLAEKQASITEAVADRAAARSEALLEALEKAEEAAVFDRDALKTATSAQIFQNLVPVSEARMAYRISDAIRALLPEGAEPGPTLALRSLIGAIVQVETGLGLDCDAAHAGRIEGGGREFARRVWGRFTAAREDLPQSVRSLWEAELSADKARRLAHGADTPEDPFQPMVTGEEWVRLHRAMHGTGREEAEMAFSATLNAGMTPDRDLKVPHPALLAGGDWETEKRALVVALHEAIRRPMGVALAGAGRRVEPRLANEAVNPQSDAADPDRPDAGF